MDFVLGIQKIKRGANFIFVVVDNIFLFATKNLVQFIWIFQRDCQASWGGVCKTIIFNREIQSLLNIMVKTELICNSTSQIDLISLLTTNKFRYADDMAYYVKVLHAHICKRLEKNNKK